MSSPELEGQNLDARPERGGLSDALVEAAKRRVVAMVYKRVDTPEERATKRDALLAVFDDWKWPGMPVWLMRVLKAWMRPALVSLLDNLLEKLAVELTKEL